MNLAHMLAVRNAEMVAGGSERVAEHLYTIGTPIRVGVVNALERYRDTAGKQGLDLRASTSGSLLAYEIAPGRYAAVLRPSELVQSRSVGAGGLADLFEIPEVTHSSLGPFAERVHAYQHRPLILEQRGEQFHVIEKGYISSSPTPPRTVPPVDPLPEPSRVASSSSATTPEPPGTPPEWMTKRQEASRLEREQILRDYAATEAEADRVLRRDAADVAAGRRPAAPSPTSQPRVSHPDPAPSTPKAPPPPSPTRPITERVREAAKAAPEHVVEAASALEDRARRAETWLGQKVSSGYGSVVKTKLGAQFLNTGVGAWFDKLSPAWKVGATMGAAMAAVQLARFFRQHLFTGAHDTPPPAYQGAYGRIDGMRAHGWSDFGSGIRLNRVARRPLMPVRHSTSHHAYTGFVQEL